MKKNWEQLSHVWKEQIFLNYLLSLQSIEWRKSAFLDDSYGLKFIMCDILNLGSEEPGDDLLLLEKYTMNKIQSLNELEINKLFGVKEVCLQDVNSLKPLEWFPNLKLVYLDHCEIKDINTLINLSQLFFYESPEYPTNKPSLYKNYDFFSNRVNIISNPYLYVTEYFVSR